MSKKPAKESHFIPSPFKVVTEYENEFVNIWNDNTAKSISELLKYVVKTTASIIKENKQ